MVTQDKKINKSCFNFENTYTNLPESFYSEINLDPVKKPELVIFNEDLAKSLEIDADCLKSEELTAEISAGKKICTVEYDYLSFHLSMQCFACRIVSGTLTLLEHENARWLSASELRSVKWLPADEEIISKVISNKIPHKRSCVFKFLVKRLNC